MKTFPARIVKDGVQPRIRHQLWIYSFSIPQLEERVRRGENVAEPLSWQKSRMAKLEADLIRAIEVEGLQDVEEYLHHPPSDTWWRLDGWQHPLDPEARL